MHKQEVADEYQKRLYPTAGTYPVRYIKGSKYNSVTNDIFKLIPPPSYSYCGYRLNKPNNS